VQVLHKLPAGNRSAGERRVTPHAQRLKADGEPKFGERKEQVQRVNLQLRRDFFSGRHF